MATHARRLSTQPAAELLHSAEALVGALSRVPVSNISENQHKESLLSDVKYEHIVMHETYGVYGHGDLTRS